MSPPDGPFHARVFAVLAKVTSLAACATLGVLALAPTLAHANGRFPSADHLVARAVTRPGPSSQLLLRATFGLALSKDRGASWDWVCESAIGYSGTLDPAVSLTATGRALVGLPNGLSVSDPTSCTWGLAAGGLAARRIVDVAVRDGAPARAIALGATHAGQDGAGRLIYDSRVFASNDDGATWNATSPSLDPTLVVETADLARSDPNRVYVSATRGEGAPTGGYLLVSDDAGATWTEREIPLDLANERAPFIAAVDPENADLVYVRTNGKLGSRVLVTRDAGATWSVAFTGGALLGFALSPDGAKVYLGGPEAGLHVATREALVFAKRAAIEVRCLMASGDELFACSGESSGFTVGASRDDGQTFAPLLHLNTVRGPLACPATSSASVCAAEWPALRERLAFTPPDGGPVVGDAAPVSRDAPSANPVSTSCGCSVYNAREHGRALGPALAVLALAIRRSRRSRTRRVARVVNRSVA